VESARGAPLEHVVLCEPLDARRFRTAAVHYTAGRPPYPRALIEGVAGFCGFTREHRLLDLGTGPGVVAVAFAPYVGSVLAVDPEPEMLRIAREAVRAAGAAVEVREGSSETLEPAWGHFRAVTLGRSFHWMDRAQTLRRLDGLLEPEGAVILFDDELADTPENAALRAWWAVIERYSADDPARAERRSPDWQDHESVLRTSAFSCVDRLVHLHRYAVTVEGLIHRALSMSSTSASRLGPHAEAMVADIQAALAPFATTGEMVEPMEWTAIVARRPVPEPRRSDRDRTPDRTFPAVSKLGVEPS
jgi:SAM-dependent methyltransferase